MSTSLFGDKVHQPEEPELRAALDEQWASWVQIREYIRSTYGGSLEEWKFYGQSSGWTLVLKQKKRTILYLLPGLGRFRAVFVFGEKAVVMADQFALPPHVLTAIREATPHVEGRSFQVEVAGADDLAVIKTLVAIKTAANG
ncbi:MAG: DUF3788 family protein [Mycobacterium leprae]